MLELRGVSLDKEGSLPVLDCVSLHVCPGEKVALMGANGSGKSTLLCVACALQAPSRGVVAVDGEQLDWRSESSLDRIRQLVGRVGQDPDDQMVATDVFGEVAFGPCNLGLQPDVIMALVRGALADCDVSDLADRDVSTLSGGQRQRVALAGILAMKPRYLLLDEPCSMLDARARSTILHVVDKLAADGCGVLHVTHSLDDVLLYDRVVVLGCGRVVWEGSPRDLVCDANLRSRACCRASSWLEMAGWLQAEGLLAAHAPLEDAGRCARMLDARGRSRARELASAWFDGPRARRPEGAELVGRDLTRSYPRAPHALAGVDARVRAGEVVLVLGGTGSGKSTLLRLLAGLEPPDGGDVCVSPEAGPAKSPVPGMVGISFQRAADQLFAQTVLDDVAFGPRNLGLSEPDARACARHALSLVGLDATLEDASPFALSGGQARRVALAGVLAMGCPFVALDEPTVGLDAPGVHDLLEVTRTLARSGVGVIVVTHDPEPFAALATRAYVLAGGGVALCGAAHEVLADVGGLASAGLQASALARFWQALDNDGVAS